MQLGNVRLSDDEAKMVDELLPLFDNNRSNVIREAIRLLHVRHCPPRIIGKVAVQSSVMCQQCGTRQVTGMVYFSGGEVSWRCDECS